MQGPVVWSSTEVEDYVKKSKMGRVSRFYYGPTVRKPGILLDGKSGEIDAGKIQKALCYNDDLSNQFIIAPITPTRESKNKSYSAIQTPSVREVPRKTKKYASRKKKQLEINFAENPEVAQLNTIFGDVEDFDLMTEVVPKDRYVLKKPLSSPQVKNGKRKGAEDSFWDDNNLNLDQEEELVENAMLPDESKCSYSLGRETVHFESSLRPDLEKSECLYTREEEYVEDSLLPDESNWSHSLGRKEERVESSLSLRPDEMKCSTYREENVENSHQNESKCSYSLDRETVHFEKELETRKGTEDSFWNDNNLNLDQKEELVENAMLPDESKCSYSLGRETVHFESSLRPDLEKSECLYTREEEYVEDSLLPDESNWSHSLGRKEERVESSLSLRPDVEKSKCSHSLGRESSTYSKELETLLKICEQKRVMTWDDYLVSTCSLGNCVKLGEGTYGEVYSVEIGGKDVALKVIPFAIDGEQTKRMVNGDSLKPPNSTLHELLITRELSKLGHETTTPSYGFVTPSFVRLAHASVVKGNYPEKLLDEWDRFGVEQPDLAQNERPSEYATVDQHFIVFALSNGGRDLESYKIRNQRESFSIFYQIALSLMVAEEAMEFEHRDLHIGNVLIDQCPEAENIRYIHDGETIEIHSCGVRVSIIDFTNSRMKIGEITVAMDLSEDEALFQQQGADYQFEIYRMMRTENKNNWWEFTPKTNLCWLHYLSRKLFEIPRLFREKRRKELLPMFDRMLEMGRVVDFLKDEHFCSAFKDLRV